METLLHCSLWYLTLQILALGAYGILRSFNLERETIYALSKILGPVLFALLIWFENEVFELASSAFNVRLIAASVCILSLIAWLRDNFRNNSKLTFDAILGIEFTYLGGFVFFLLLRAYHPEIHGGEKPMDLTFLNYFTRLQTLPPEDPWAAGEPLGYYYFGYYLFAQLLKLTAIPSAVGYNLAVVTSAQFLLVGLYALFHCLFRSSRKALCGALTISLIGNFETLRLLLFENMRIGFLLFWNSTRLFEAPGFTEYPIWSAAFGDLHPHFISLPILVTFITLFALYLRQKNSTLGQYLLLGLLLATLFITNLWDFISAGIFCCIFLIAQKSFPKFMQKTHSLLNVTFFLIGICLILYPFCSSLPLMQMPKLGWNSHTNSGSILFRHLGQFLSVIAIYLVLAGISLKRWNLKLASLLLLVFLLPSALSLLRSFFLGIALPWDCMSIYGLLMLAALVSVYQESERARIAGVFLFCAATLGVFAENFFLFDSMNTVFKFYYHIWIFCGVPTVLLFADVWKGLRKLRSTKVAMLFKISSLILLTLSILTAGAGSILTVSSWLNSGKGVRPSLNGLKYLHLSEPEEAALSDWIDSNIAGLPVILEAQAASYKEFTRVSMRSGLPTLLGWEHHVYQRGVSKEEIRARRRSISTIYNSPDPQLVLPILAKYDVRYIVVGKLEREIYAIAGIQKFDSNPSIFSKQASFGDTAIFKVVAN